MITALTLSPLYRRLGLYFQIHRHNINFEKIMEFIIMLHRHLGRKFILVLDRFSAHRKAVRLLQSEHPDWFEVEWLPAYAPELNPVEMVWNHTKYADMANFIPADVEELYQSIVVSIENTRTQTSLIRSFFQHAGLEV